MGDWCMDIMLVGMLGLASDDANDVGRLALPWGAMGPMGGKPPAIEWGG